MFLLPARKQEFPVVLEWIGRFGLGQPFPELLLRLKSPDRCLQGRERVDDILM